MIKIKVITVAKPSRWWKAQAKATRGATAAVVAVEAVGLGMQVEEELEPPAKCLVRSRPVMAMVTETMMNVDRPIKRKRKMTPIQRVRRRAFLAKVPWKIMAWMDWMVKAIKT